MVEQTDRYGMLDLMILPGFCVTDGKIQKVNQAAAELPLAPGMELKPLLLTGVEEYQEFTGGCLYLQLTLDGQSWGASVTRMPDTDVFLLEPSTEDSELRAIALAARELRQPLSSLIAIVDTLLPRSLPEDDEKAGALLTRMSRGLYQMQRTLGNMSDAGLGTSLSHLETRNISQVFDDIFEKAGTLLSAAGAELHYTGLRTDVYGMIDALQMERAVLNILSNSLKFMPEGAVLEASLTRRGNFLRLSILDNGPGIGDGVLGSLFSRYLRQPGLEDSRHGIGLGMVMIRNVAASHGGAVLVDQPDGAGTRVTLTMKIQPGTSSAVRSPISDLTGGRDIALIELSGCLPLSVYEKER